MKVQTVAAISWLGLALGGCTTAAVGQGLPPGPWSGGAGVFGGTHIRYDSTIQAGRLYRTVRPAKLEFGSPITPLCERDFAHIDVAVGPPQNHQDYRDELSGKVSASASGIQWVQALFNLSGAAEAAITADFKNVYSRDGADLDEVDKKLGANCRALMKSYQAKGHAVFLIKRIYQTDETVTLTAMTKGSAAAGIGNLQFVQVGPSGTLEGGRTQSRVFRGTVVEIEPWTAE